MSVLDLLNVFTESENCDLCVCARESESCREQGGK